MFVNGALPARQQRTSPAATSALLIREHLIAEFDRAFPT